jgi:hypothetical protein
VIRLRWLLLAILAGCEGAAACKPPLPGPVAPDATPDGGCQVDDAITKARLIRNPDGTPLVIHCDAGAP